MAHLYHFHCYQDFILPDNSEIGFYHLLKENYRIVKKGIFEAGEIKEIPVTVSEKPFKDKMWEFDIMWKVKK